MSAGCLICGLRKSLLTATSVSGPDDAGVLCELYIIDEFMGSNLDLSIGPLSSSLLVYTANHVDQVHHTSYYYLHEATVRQQAACLSNITPKLTSIVVLRNVCMGDSYMGNDNIWDTGITSENCSCFN